MTSASPRLQSKGWLKGIVLGNGVMNPERELKKKGVFVPKERLFFFVTGRVNNEKGKERNGRPAVGENAVVVEAGMSIPRKTTILPLFGSKQTLLP